MSIDQASTSTEAIDLARECLYRFLAAALRQPGSAGWHPVVDPVNQRLACDAADLLQVEASQAPMPLGFGELPSAKLALEPLCDQLAATEQLHRDYTRVFGLITARECPPYETEYHPGADPFFCSQQMADIAGFYRAFGLRPSQTRPERPDHLALELEFLAFVLLKRRLALANASENPKISEQVSICEEAMYSFFKDHLIWWAPSFATGLRRKAGTGVYACLGEVLSAFLPVERARFGIPAPRMPVQVAAAEQPDEEAGCAGCTLQP